MLRNPDRPSNWEEPGVPDGLAGEWPDIVASGLAEVAAGLTEEYKSDRKTLSDALASLNALINKQEVEAALQLSVSRETAATAVETAAAVGTAAAPGTAAAVGTATAVAAAMPPAMKECSICLDAPREVRFPCGHALVCVSCLSAIRARARTKSIEASDATRSVAERAAAREEAVARCPTCRAAIGPSPIAERGAQLAMASTFVQPAVPKRI